MNKQNHIHTQNQNKTKSKAKQTNKQNPNPKHNTKKTTLQPNQNSLFYTG